MSCEMLRPHVALQSVKKMEMEISPREKGMDTEEKRKGPKSNNKPLSQCQSAHTAKFSFTGAE